MRYIAVLLTLAVVMTGCATATPTGLPPVDISGPWSGSWEGYGIFDIKRHDSAEAKFEQQGRTGTGRLWLEGILASESIPVTMRMAGADGVPVLFEVTGNRVVIRDVRDERLMMAEFAVNGDRMVGRMLTTDQPARIVLERVKPRVAAPTPPPAPPAPAVAVAAPPAAEPVRPAPMPARPAPQEFSATDALKPVYFAFDRATIEPSEATVMDGNVRWLQANPNVLVIVEGHCDERGTNAYNLALGERRARAIRDHLLSHGIAATRITVISYGEERPTCRDHNEACWKENRRASFVIKPKE
jgi:peptidoglycan-associated lipoprotein